MALPATPLSICGAEVHGAEVHGAELHGAELHDAEVEGAELHGSGPHASSFGLATEASRARSDAQRRLAAGAFKTAAELQSTLDFQGAERILAFGIPVLDAALPQGGLPQGSVVELQVQGASGAATSLALCACRAAQNAGERWQQSAHKRPAERDRSESARPWCAFIDPSASLFAPGVARLGVDLSRLLVVRPEPEAIERVAIRIAEAKAVSLLVIDLLGFDVQGSSMRGTLGSRSAPTARALSSQRWQRTVRRLALAIKQLGTTILLLTPAEPRQSLPLPVAMRLELSRSTAESFALRVGKERSGRVCSARSIPWSALEPASASEESPFIADRVRRTRAPAAQVAWH